MNVEKLELGLDQEVTIGPIISTGCLHVVVVKFIVHKYMYILVN